MSVELIIQNGSGTYIPAALSGVTWATERKGVPGKLTFSIVSDGGTEFGEGNAVRLTVDGNKMFFGYVFSQKRNKQGVINITAYDQLRYLQNKDVFSFRNVTASDVINDAAARFQLKTGAVANTEFKIKTLKESGASVFDVFLKALDFEITNNKKMYVLYDDFGELVLKPLDDMKLDILIDEETGENFEYSSSIDDNTYNKIRLAFDNDKTGKRDIYITLDSDNIKDWGVLQFFDTLREGENGQAKADALLSLYNAKTRSLRIKNALGDCRVRAGSLIAVKLMLGDISLNNFMLVEKCTHTFNTGEHFMDLTLRGGAINA